MGWRSKKKEVSYLMQMLQHRWNINSFLGSLAISTFLTIPFGGVGLIPFLGYLGGLTLAALTVPDKRPWKEYVDKRIRDEQREAAREHLKQEITERVGSEHTFWAAYYRMLERRDSLAKMAAQADTALSIEDVAGLDDATVDYLGLWLARIAIHERGKAVERRSLIGRIADIEQRLKTDMATADRRRLEKAKKDLENLVRRHEEMASRDASLEASMLSMADTFDEVYQRIVANPTSREEIAGELKVAVERMNAEEEIDYELEDEFEALMEMER